MPQMGRAQMGPVSSTMVQNETPTSAEAMARRICSLGWVTVSLRRSMIAVLIKM